MIKYKMQLNCGCCEDDEIYFENDEQALEIVQAIGLTSSASFVDAKGVKHADIDTFYGINRADFVDTRNSFQILLDQLK